MSEPQLGKHRAVSVGGGAGGLELATRPGDKYGRRRKPDVTLIERKPKLHEIAAGRLVTAAQDLES
jgi:NADH dehydrogenase